MFEIGYAILAVITALGAFGDMVRSRVIGFLDSAILAVFYGAAWPLVWLWRAYEGVKNGRR